jgi:hypothetical protein
MEVATVVEVLAKEGIILEALYQQDQVDQEQSELYGQVLHVHSHQHQ